MSRTNVIVAAISNDVQAEVIAECVADRADMHLVGGKYVLTAQLDKVLASLSSSDPCALILVGKPTDTNEIAQRWLAERSTVVVVHVDIMGDVVNVGIRDPRLNALLAALRELVQQVGARKGERVTRIQLPATAGTAQVNSSGKSAEHPLLNSAVNWVHTILRNAVSGVTDENGDIHGLSVTRKTLLQSLDPVVRAEDLEAKLSEADRALDLGLANATNSKEPLALLFQNLPFTKLEFRMFLLALAPELDLRFQRCIGFLLDELNRRVGTIALYSGLLGNTASIRQQLAERGTLWHWLLFEQQRGHAPAADEPVRVDPALVSWLLGDSEALSHDPKLRRVTRAEKWPGSNLLQRVEEDAAAAELIRRLCHSEPVQWLLLCGTDPASWRALVELGSRIHIAPLRVEAGRFAELDSIDTEECAIRIARMQRLTGKPVIIDAANDDGGDTDDVKTELLIARIAEHCRAALICRDQSRGVKLLGATPHESPFELALCTAARADAIREAGKQTDTYLPESVAETLANRYPLSVEQMEHASRLACDRPLNWSVEDPKLHRFLTACQDVASKGISHLAERLDPMFSLEQVVLPTDRKQQLSQIVDHVRLATQVLDHWKFRAQLPYGRGVTALFFGPSGTGKTMAALGIAQRLGIQVLRLDLSKVVSKYIGDTEKNVDQVFTDAQKSGAAILIDEAEALLGKRSEVKDAHDRYANIEVAYLLQRMEAFEGLAILTTNLRQNIDSAFLRRLRFIIDFPRPTVEARKQIWVQCLPDGSHVLDELAFRQLARKVDVTGGNIRQITLRAAFLAAASETLINMEHIAEAVRAEFAKLGMPPIDLVQADKKVPA
ncbi:MAG: ATP-binding protein [Acidobacteriaceae bacterium]